MKIIYNEFVKKQKVGIIGAGGAARALSYGIRKKQGDLTIINRDIKKGEALANLYDASFINIDSIDELDYIFSKIEEYSNIEQEETVLLDTPQTNFMSA